VENPHRLRYNILYSPTYRLPVLYWTADTPMTAEEIKDIFNPKTGIISQGEHLLHGEPWWFVHPCNTGEAMLSVHELVAGNEDRYLSVWLGFIKDAAGLR
jgi:ubiquitin-like-conjugating enzyme ATG10